MQLTIQLTDDQVKALAQAAEKIPAHRVGEMRKHPNLKPLFAVWTGARWFTFSENHTQTTSGALYEPNSDSTWDGMRIEEWDEYQ